MNAVDELNLRLGIGPPRPRLPITLLRSGYTAVRQLGKGSFGNAYLVFHKERNQQYVVKHVNMANMTSRQRKDAHQEIVVLQQLEHPNIIRYVEFCEEHPHLYIVMEYADGGDVYTHVKNLKSSVWALGGGGGGGSGGGGSSGGLTEEQVISLFVQTTMAVKYMHDRRLLHRDIKSQNVFLTRNHVVKLGDFGISTVLMSTVAMAQTMCGTPCYFSPELCEGKPYNNKSDVWALGILLYELCTTGRLPFEAATMNRLMEDICHKEPRRIPASFSDELWELVLWLLKKDPRQRPDAGQILRAPVLVRAIPNIIKKLSATDGRSEDEFRRVLADGATPPPPIRPAMELRPQREKEKERAAPSASVAAAVAAAERVGFAERRNGEYPFILQRNVGNAAKDGCGGLLERLKEQRLLQKQRENEEAVKKAFPSNQPILADAFNYVPDLLRGKQQHEQNENSTNDNNKVNDNHAVRNLNAVEKNTPSKENNMIARGAPHPPQDADNGNAKKAANPAPAAVSNTGGARSKSVTNLPLRDLFLIYDENKKRIVNEREQRMHGARKPMNYQPAGMSPYHVRPSIAELNAAGAGGEPKRKAVPEVPHRAVYDKPKAVPFASPKVEEKPIPAPPHRVSDVSDAAAAAAAAASAAAAAAPSPPLSKGVSNFQSEELHQKSKPSDTRNDVKENNDNKQPSANEPPADLALVLQEMTHHLESVLSSVGRTENIYENSGAKGTQWAESNAASLSAGMDRTETSPCPTSEVYPDDGGQEFSDAMGTTLNVQDLQRQTSTPRASSEEADGHATGENIPLCIMRYDAVWPPLGGMVASSRMAAVPSGGEGGEMSEEKNARPVSDAHASKQRTSSPTVYTNPDADLAQEVREARAVSLSSEAAAAAAYREEGEEEEGPIFTGGCLCDGVHLTGLASAIYGSFVCNCVVCSRLSGAMMGVEWLHLPDVPFECLFAETIADASAVAPSPELPTRRPTEEVSAGAGMSAAQVLTKNNSSPALKKNSVAAADAKPTEEGEGSIGKGTVRFPPHLKKFVVEVPMIDEDGVVGVGVYAVYFCGRCGSTIGMDHSDIPGGIVAKAVLSDASLATLESFQQAMSLGSEERLD